MNRGRTSNLPTAPGLKCNHDIEEPSPPRAQVTEAEKFRLNFTSVPTDYYAHIKRVEMMTSLCRVTSEYKSARRNVVRVVEANNYQ